MTIDNFDLFRPHLEFKKAVKTGGKKDGKEINDTYDRYIIQILRRAKDVRGTEYGSNETNRLIKTYEVSSVEYYDKKRSTIIDLCRSNHARAYILPQVRSVRDCMIDLLKLCLDSLDNPTIKFQHILRSALCRMHKSRDKKWIIDLDNDEMYGVTKDDVFNYVKDALVACGKTPDDAFLVPTRNGWHIVLRPIDSKALNEQFPMAFKGVKKGYKWGYVAGWLTAKGTLQKPDWESIEFLKTDPCDCKRLEKAIEQILGAKAVADVRAHCKTDITGWMHHDDMSLLYYSDDE